MIDRKKKLRSIQLSLVIIGSLIILFTYLDNSKKNLIPLNSQNQIDNKLKNENENNAEGNIFYNIEYSGLDLAGNRYILKSKTAKTSSLERNLIDMTDVNATFYFKDGTILKVKSDYGEYNNSSLDIKFKKNIKADYERSTLSSQYAEYSNSLGFLTISGDVKVNDIQGNLTSDKLIFDIRNQILNIESFNDSKISVNVDTDEKRF